MNNSIVTNFQIGCHSLEVSYDPAARFGYLYSAQTSGNPQDKYMQTFFPRYLEGITGEVFPENFQLSIYNSGSWLKNFCMVYVQKKSGKCQLKHVLDFNYFDWDMPESLGSFLDRYKEKIKEIPNFISVRKERSDYGYSIDFISSVDALEDIYYQIRNIEDSLESLYRENLTIPAHAETKKYGEDRIHWWIRYVIVPLIGSSTIAAALVKIFQ